MSVVINIKGKELKMELKLVDGDATVVVTEVDGNEIVDGNLVCFSEEGCATQLQTNKSIGFPLDKLGQIVTY